MTIDNLKIPRYAIQIGVFSTESKRKKTFNIGVTNAELMFIHENGSPLRKVPSRPVLHYAIDYGRQLILKSKKKLVETYLYGNEQAYVKELNKLCIRIENYARKMIYDYDKRLAPNAQSTIQRKGDDHPLFDTGQLARSITCRAIKII